MTLMNWPKVRFIPPTGQFSKPSMDIETWVKGTPMFHRVILDVPVDVAMRIHADIEKALKELKFHAERMR